mmetsp:Transcript_16084/g.29261  ORF Transcript_16084/g.29261 Transcript_16084/m.29261 type:complete len:94 (-) Transcript_16084:1339-1620(-)
MKLSASEIVLEYFCPAMGMVFANIMFAAPLMAVRKAVQRANLGDLNPTPWAFMTGNTVGWITYSFLIQVRLFEICERSNACLISAYCARSIMG